MWISAGSVSHVLLKRFEAKLASTPSKDEKEKSKKKKRKRKENEGEEEKGQSAIFMMDQEIEKAAEQQKQRKDSEPTQNPE